MKTTTITIESTKKNIWATVSAWARMHNQATIGWSIIGATVSVEITAAPAYGKAAAAALASLLS
jgi:hypothetical protein